MISLKVFGALFATGGMVAGAIAVAAIALTKKPSTSSPSSTPKPSPSSNKEDKNKAVDVLVVSKAEKKEPETTKKVVPSLKTYFVVVKDIVHKNTSLLKETCPISACSLYEMQGYLTTDDSKLPTAQQISTYSDVTENLQYVLQIASQPLNYKDQVELTFGENQKVLLEVKSEAALSENKKIKPTLPTGILTEDKLPTINKTNKFDALQENEKNSWKYHVNLYPTHIKRASLEHEDYYIFSWKPYNTEPDALLSSTRILWDANTKDPVDKYIFKPIDEQGKGAMKNYTFALNVASKEYGNNGKVEIYEISDQQPLIKAFTEQGKKEGAALKQQFTPTGIDWDAITKENLMVTKLSALKWGKYYKFILKDFNELPKDKPMTSFDIKVTYTTDYTASLIRFEADNDANKRGEVCQHFKSDTNNTKCNIF